MNRKIVRIALVSGAAMLALSPAVANHSWGNYHWARTGKPLNLEVVTAVTSKWPFYVDQAIGDWNAKSSLLVLTRPIPEPVVNAKKCTAIKGKVLVCAESYGQRGWLGLASIWASGDHIVQATTKLNDSYFNTATYGKPEWRAMVTCQEIGHDFGLDHQDETFNNPNRGTCMDYTNQPAGGGSYGLPNTAPNDHDWQELGEEIYLHLDSTNTSATQLSSTNFGVRQVGRAPASSAAAANIPGDSPAEWGRAVATDGAGRPNVYVLDLGGGNRKITHVLWAIGEGPRGH